jgi:hypothetical protein
MESKIQTPQSFADLASWQSSAEYVERCRALENDGLTTSDAQAAANAEYIRARADNGAERTVMPGETFAVTTDRGGHCGRVSSEWFGRPDDERFTSLAELHDFTKRAHDESRATLLDVRGIRVDASRDNPDRLALAFADQTRGGEIQTDIAPTHWSFSQLASLLGVPAGYLRKLPASIAGINLQFALANFREELVKAYVRQNGRTELRAATGPSYGRIPDYQLVSAVQKIVDAGGAWKVPGVLDWSTMTYDPFAPVTKESTTLYASDRDVFLFLVDDTHPIEIGKLPNGEPDVIFRGFFAWNSEVGSKTIGVATFYLRGVCMNRNLWGVEGFREFNFKHSSNAPERFAREIIPALQSYSHQGTGKLLAGVQAAKSAIVAKTDEDRTEFLLRQSFTRPQAKSIIETVLREEQKTPESVWDFVQGITAVARAEGHQDERIELERRAGKLLDKVAA